MNEGSERSARLRRWAGVARRRVSIIASTSLRTARSSAGGELFDAAEPFQEPRRLGTQRLAHRFDAEQLVGRDLESPGEIDEELAGRLRALHLVVRDHAARHVDERGQLVLREPARLAQLEIADRARAARSPGYRTPQEYRQRANEIYNDPNATRTVFPSTDSKFPGETHIQSGNDLLRLDPSGNFRSMYPVQPKPNQ